MNDRFDDSSLLKKNEDFEKRLKGAEKSTRECASLIESIMEKGGIPVRLEPRGYGATSSRHYTTGIKKESVPDFVAKALDGDQELARLDVKCKAKAEWAGLINVRDAAKYVQSAIKDGLPVFICSLVDSNCSSKGDPSKITGSEDRLFFAPLLSQDFKKLDLKKQWDGNWTLMLPLLPISQMPSRFKAVTKLNHASIARTALGMIRERLVKENVNITIDWD